jgi:hypothetical protein
LFVRSASLCFVCFCLRLGCALLCLAGAHAHTRVRTCEHKHICMQTFKLTRMTTVAADAAALDGIHAHSHTLSHTHTDAHTHTHTPHSCHVRNRCRCRRSPFFQSSRRLRRSRRVVRHPRRSVVRPAA